MVLEKNGSNQLDTKKDQERDVGNGAGNERLTESIRIPQINLGILGRLLKGSFKERQLGEDLDEAT